MVVVGIRSRGMGGRGRVKKRKKGSDWQGRNRKIINEPYPVQGVRGRVRGIRAARRGFIHIFLCSFFS